MFGLSIRGNVDRMALKLQSRAGKLYAKSALTMERVTLKLERDLKHDKFTGQASESGFWGKGGAKGDELAVRTGHARRSLTHKVFTKVFTVVGVVGSPLDYVRLHEFGGEVHGKPYLRIPTGYAKTPAGVDRYAGRSARTIPNTRIFRSRAGNLFIWVTRSERSKASGRPVPLYLLKPSVKFRARHMLRNTLAANRRYVHEQFRGVTAYIAKGI
jgi:phage gpG-like protein